MNPLAEYNAGSTAAGDAMAGLIVLIPVLLVIYGVVCFLVPIYIYRIMRRTTLSYETLKRIEQLLTKQQQPRTSTVAAANLYSGSLPPALPVEG